MNKRAFLLALALAGCHPAAPHATPPLAGAAIGGPFALVDQAGRTVTERSFAGRYRIMYFGYTFCPDVCPTDAQAIGAGLRLLEGSDPALAARVVPVFVTVDPARDTSAVLGRFVVAFHPRFVGLTGSPDAIARTAKEYAVYYSKGAGSSDGYLVNHSRTAYLMDPDNKPLALLPTEQGAQAVADEIRRWAT
ncbi:SCO family protein [Sphingomonas bacterium]|uniref:SCO family protein n=1 Tax=Sphingomonas bacterium TaxID=1895847 RepID=UPI001575C838|nr:SCO family protein [Sphingomonas bacterium]